jgi:hypothetical protein
MNPALIGVGAANAEPLSIRAENLRAMSKEKLRFLCRRSPRLAKHRRNGPVRADVSWTQCSGQSINGISRPGLAGTSRLLSHFLHFTTPRKLHITQMKVPQSVHGYPSDARSSLPHARQIIASFSRISGT